MCVGLAGPAVSLVPLILAKNSCGLGMAVACLTAFMGLQAFAYSGFHAYVQARPGWALSFCNYISLSLFDVQSCSPLQTSCSNISMEHASPAGVMFASDAELSILNLMMQS